MSLPGAIQTFWPDADRPISSILGDAPDGNERGFLNAGGSHTLERFINEVARDVVDPEKEIPVSDRQRARRILNGSPEEMREARERADLRIAALGSGSDYTPFLQHLGISTLNLGYGGEGEADGVYHSIYDSFDHYIRFVDPTFDYGVALAKTAGRAVLRFADADYLPLTFSNFAETVGRYVGEVMKLASDERETILEKNRRISDKTFEAAADPTKPFVAPKQVTHTRRGALRTLRRCKTRSRGCRRVRKDTTWRCVIQLQQSDSNRATLSGRSTAPSTKSSMR